MRRSVRPTVARWRARRTPGPGAVSSRSSVLPRPAVSTGGGGDCKCCAKSGSAAAARLAEAGAMP
jgi:hypothetical protein